MNTEKINAAAEAYQDRQYQVEHRYSGEYGWVIEDFTAGVEWMKDKMIEWLKGRIQSCEEMQMENEKWAFIQCLKQLDK